MSTFSSARRPLKTRDAGWARRLARWLAERQVSPNRISLLSLLFAVLGGVAMLAAPTLEAGTRSTLLAFAAGCIQLRLLCNLLDGMVAVEGGLGSHAGEVYNDVPDRLRIGDGD